MGLSPLPCPGGSECAPDPDGAHARSAAARRDGSGSPAVGQASDPILRKPRRRSRRSSPDPGAQGGHHHPILQGRSQPWRSPASYRTSRFHSMFLSRVARMLGCSSRLRSNAVIVSRQLPDLLAGAASGRDEEGLARKDPTGIGADLTAWAARAVTLRASCDVGRPFSAFRRTGTGSAPQAADVASRGAPSRAGRPARTGQRPPQDEPRATRARSRTTDPDDGRRSIGMIAHCPAADLVARLGAAGLGPFAPLLRLLDGGLSRLPASPLARQ